jgi:hypothetical protein
MEKALVKAERPVKGLAVLERGQSSEQRFPISLKIAREALNFPLQLRNHAPVSVFPSPCSASRTSFPVTVFDITLKKRTILVNDIVVEIPLGARSRLTVRAIKKLSHAYTGAVVLASTPKGWVRLRDSDVVEIPRDGHLSLKSVPSFRLE